MVLKMKLNNFIFGIILIIGLKLNSSLGQQQIGDSCTVTSTRSAGTCKLLNQCQSAFNDLRFKGIRPTVCGYLNLQQIVCCTNPAAATTETVPLTSTEKNTKRHKKCVEYSAAVYEKVIGLPLLEGGSSIKKDSDRCGHTAVPLIVGGAPASAREFPHSALLGYDTAEGTIAWDCGGALISPLYVLTAGHCLISSNRTPVKRVRLGDLNLASTTDEARPEEFDVIEIIKHPEYVSSSQYNDLGLLKLNKTVILNPYIRPICLPVRSDLPKKAIASGWGRVEWAGLTSNTLLKVTLDIYSQKECNETYQYSINRKLSKGIVEQTQICAGSRTEAKDTCQGDSGGPLQNYHSEIYCMYTQTGITSFGRGCGSIDVPGVYTRVSNYVNWIESVVWPNDTSP